MNITDTTICLASLNPPSLYDFYDSMEAALAKQNEANEYEALSHRNVPTYEPLHYRPIQFGSYLQAERAFYLDGPATEITEEKFDEMLNCLPPMAWRNDGTFESFLMSEMSSGSYTYQYARHGERYYKKMVDARDKSTWMIALTVAR